MAGGCIPLCEQQRQQHASALAAAGQQHTGGWHAHSGIGRPHQVATRVCVMLRAFSLRTAKLSQSILVVPVALCFERSWNLGTPWFCMHLLRPAEMHAVCVGTVDSRGGRIHRSTPPMHVVGCRGHERAIPASRARHSVEWVSTMSHSVHTWAAFLLFLTPGPCQNNRPPVDACHMRLVLGFPVLGSTLACRDGVCGHQHFTAQQCSAAAAAGAALPTVGMHPKVTWWNLTHLVHAPPSWAAGRCAAPCAVSGLLQESRTRHGGALFK
jgi:hypothetical protein